jgi:hypothetical protein
MFDFNKFHLICSPTTTSGGVGVAGPPPTLNGLQHQPDVSSQVNGNFFLSQNIN